MLGERIYPDDVAKGTFMASAPPLPKSFEDAARRHSVVEEELERVCASAHFRTSKRSCEFLQYIVRVTLDGRMDSLKERSIGIDLFGRDASYEPSSDATVRVRANEVRKRLSSYYSTLPPGAMDVEVRIDLPTGSYVPRFQAPAQQRDTAIIPVSAPVLIRHVKLLPDVPPIHALTLMRPALFALLVCTLLLRHQLENREEYLRFWDRLLSGRSAMLLSVAPQDRANLASSLYPLVWVAGRYGVDAAMEGDSLTGTGRELLASVQVSYATPPGMAGDGRLRWATQQTDGSALVTLKDRQQAGRALASAALLTILPEDAETLHVQGTDGEAIRRLLEDLSSDRHFPSGVSDRLEGRHAFQILLFRDGSGQWRTELFSGGA
jgi:hypothetical protein